MHILRFEIQKILHSRFKLILLIATVILFPVIIKLLSHLNAVEDNIPKEFFADNVAYATLALSQMYFFIPVWVIVLTGIELSNGHVNRVVFFKSRKYYFKSKLYFCCLLTLFFSLLTTASLIIALETTPYQSLEIGFAHYASYFIQFALSTIAFTLLLLSLTFIFKSAIKTFIIYFIWSFVEAITFSFVQGMYDIDLWWLPLHIVRLFYTTNGEMQLANYHNPFFENLSVVIVPLLFTAIIILVVYQYFYHSDLKTLSD